MAASAAPEGTARDATAPDTAARAGAVRDSAGQGSAGQGSAGQDSAGPEAAAEDSAAKDGTVQRRGALAHGSKSEVAYERIRAQIINGAYGPGYRLVLDRLAGEIGVSSVPIREALRRLEAEGYVDFKRNLGATVRQVDAAGYAESLQTLAILEASAVAIAAPRLTADDLAAARQLNQELAASLEDLDPVRFASLNYELHRTLYQRCPNEYLLSVVEREWTRLRGIRQPAFSFVPARARSAAAEHAELIGLIENQSPPWKIEDFAREHRMRTVDRFLRRYAGHGGDPVRGS